MTIGVVPLVGGVVLTVLGLLYGVRLGTDLVHGEGRPRVVFFATIAIGLIALGVGIETTS